MIEKLGKDTDKNFVNISELMKHLLRMENKKFFSYEEAIKFTEKILNEESKNLLIE